MLLTIIQVVAKCMYCAYTRIFVTKQEIRYIRVLSVLDEPLLRFAKELIVSEMSYRQSILKKAYANEDKSTTHLERIIFD